MLNRKQIEKLEFAEEILTCLWSELSDEKGKKVEADRLDTILDKIWRLKHYQKRTKKNAD